MDALFTDSWSTVIQYWEQGRIQRRFRVQRAAGNEESQDRGRQERPIDFGVLESNHDVGEDADVLVIRSFNVPLDDPFVLTLR